MAAQTWEAWKKENHKEFSQSETGSGSSGVSPWERWKKENTFATPEQKQSAMREKYYKASGMEDFRRDFGTFASYGIAKDTANRQWAQNIRQQRDYFSKYASHFSQEELTAFNEELDLYESIVNQRAEYAKLQPQIQEYQANQAAYQNYSAQREELYGEEGLRADTQLYKNQTAMTALAHNGDPKAQELVRKRYASLGKLYGDEALGYQQAVETQRETSGQLRKLDGQIEALDANIESAEYYLNDGKTMYAEGGREEELRQVAAWKQERDALVKRRDTIAAENEAAKKTVEGGTPLSNTYAAYAGSEQAYKKAQSDYNSANSATENVIHNIMNLFYGTAEYDEYVAAKEKDEAEAAREHRAPTYDNLIDLFRSSDYTDTAVEGMIAELPAAFAQRDTAWKALLEKEALLRVQAQKNNDAWEYEMYRAMGDENFAKLSTPDEKKKPDGALGEIYQRLIAGEKQHYDDFTFTVREKIDGKIKEKTLEGNELANISDSEKALFFYYCNNGEYEKARLLIYSLADALRYRTGEAYAENVDYPVLREIAALAWGMKRGIEGLEYGIGSLLMPLDAPDVSSEEYAGAALYEKHKGTLAGFAIGASENIGNMVPSIAGYAINPTVGLSATFFNARGNAYVEAKRNGYSEGQAWVYSTLVGASEAGLEKLLGGLGGMAKGWVPEKLSAMMPKIKGIGGKLIKGLTLNELSEITEENLQNFLEPAFKMLVGAEREYHAPGYDDFIETTIVTAITTLAFAAVQAPGQVQQEKFNRQIGKFADAAMRAEQGSAVYQEGAKLREMLDNGESISAEYMQGVYERLGVENYDSVGLSADAAQIVENAEGRIGDVDQQFFTPETAEADVDETIEAYKETASAAMQEKSATKMIDATANALKLLDAAQTNLDNAMTQGLIDQDTYSEVRQRIDETRQGAQPILDLYMNPSRSTETTSTDVQEMQQRSASGLTQDRKGADTYAEAGAQSVRDDGGRQSALDSGEQAGSVGESGSQRAADTEGTGTLTEAERKSLRNRQTARLDEVTAYKNASEVLGSEKYEGDIAELPEEYYTEGMKETAEKLVKDGIRVRYFKGKLMTETADGRLRRTPGLFRAGTNEVWASVSSARFSPEQLAMHEYYHALVSMGKANVEQTLQEIREKFSPEEFEQIAQQYIMDYRGAYEGNKIEDIYEELLADAYAGMNRFAKEKSAVQYQDVVRDQIQRGTDENERATRDTRGAPEEKFSIERVVGEKGEYENCVVLDTNLFDGISPRNWGRKLGNFVYKNLAGHKLTMLDAEGNEETVEVARENDRVTKDGAKNSHKVIDKLARNSGDNIKTLATVHLSELLRVSGNETNNIEHSHQWMDENGWTIRHSYIVDKQGNIYDATLNIANGRDRRIIYAISNVREIDKAKGTAHGDVPSTESGRGSHIKSSSSDGTIAQQNQIVKDKHSFDDEDYMLAVEAGDMDAAAETSRNRQAETEELSNHGTQNALSHKQRSAQEQPTVHSLLMETDASKVKNAIERKYLKEYRQTANRQLAEQQKLDKLQAELDALPKENRQTSRARFLRDEIIKTKNRLQICQSILTRLETDSPLTYLIHREIKPRLAEAQKTAMPQALMESATLPSGQNSKADLTATTKYQQNKKQSIIAQTGPGRWYEQEKISVVNFQDRGILGAGNPKSPDMMTTLDTNQATISSDASENGFLRSLPVSSPKSIEEAVVSVNPHFADNVPEYRNNCGNCTVAYDMQRRGYNVEAMPALHMYDSQWAGLWNGFKILTVTADNDRAAIRAIKREVKSWGAGSRGTIFIRWNYQRNGHYFNIENDRGIVRFIDPQNGSVDCEHYFEDLDLSAIYFGRTDNIEPSAKIKDHVKLRGI